MPIFEFHCQSCDKTFEKLLKAPTSTAPCPACGRPAQQIISVPAATGGEKGGCSAPAGSGFG